MNHHPRKEPRSAAFSLVEVTLALGVAAFCLVAVLGLLPVGFLQTQAAAQQTRMVNVLAAVVSDLRATAKGRAVTPRYGIDLAGTGAQTFYVNEDGSPTGRPGARATAESRYRLTLTVQPSDQATTGVAVKITWPALADPDPGVNPATRFTGFVDAFVALDRSFP